MFNLTQIATHLATTFKEFIINFAAAVDDARDFRVLVLQGSYDVYHKCGVKGTTKTLSHE